MIRPSLRRIVMLALCLVLAGSGLLSAKPLATVSSDSSALLKGAPAGFLDTVWSFLVKVWTKNGSAGDPYGVGTKNGAGLDPYGNPSNGQGSQPGAKNGCSIDPYGQCR